MYFLNEKEEKVLGKFLNSTNSIQGKELNLIWDDGNYKFYEGYEGEPEVILSVKNNELETIHIWDGFFDDIFKKPLLDGKGWNGFTRDYHQCEGAFGDYGEAIITDIQEYIEDLKIYESRKFDYEDTKFINKYSKEKQ